MSDGLGLWLRRTREARDLSLEDAEESLRIRRRYLQALEVGDYAAMPGPIQARGFLRNYARFLGLPVDDALARYDAEVHGHPLQPRPTPVQEEPARGRARNWAQPPPTLEEEITAISRSPVQPGFYRILLGVLFFFLLLFVISLVVLQFAGRESGGATASAGTPSVQLTPDAGPQTVGSQTAVAETAPPTAAPTPPTFPISADGTVRVRLMPTEHTWVSLSADNQVIFQGIAEPQQPLEAVAREMVIISTGNGAAFNVYINGTDWGMLGGRDEIVRRAWTPTGELDLESP